MPNSLPSHPACVLCGLPADGSLVRDGRTFCCWGCYHVFNVISAVAPQLDAADFKDHPVFRQAQTAGWLPGEADESSSDGPLKRGTGSERGAFPDGEDDGQRGACPPFQRREDSAKYRTYRGQLDGMMCPSCAWLAGHLAGRVDGVREVQVDFLTDGVRFAFDPLRTNPAAVGRELSRFGYTLTESAGEPGSHRPLIEFGAAVFLTANLMMLSFVSYVGLYEELDPVRRRRLPWLLFALAAPVVFYCGRSILVRGFAALRHRMPVMDSLLALGSLTAFGASTANVFIGSEHYYFDAAAVIVTLALFGRLVEGRYKRNSTAVLRSMASLLPAKARGADGRFRPVEAFRPGDRIHVERDETVPLDGTLVGGEAWVSEACLTGESRPVHKHPDSPVYAGSTVSEGDLALTVTAAYAASTLMQVLDRVREGLLRPHRVSRLANRVAAAFFPVVIALALGALALGWAAGGFSDGVLRMVAVLVVACPCALGLATPVVILRTFSVLGGRGIVLSDFAVLERLRRIRRVCFDKTGTITRGDFRLEEALAFDGTPRATAIQWAASIERGGRHPIAAALLKEARQTGLALLPTEGVRETAGDGVEGRLPDALPGELPGELAGGGPIRVGRRGWFESDGWTFPKDVPTLAGSVAFWGRDGKVCGAFRFSDPVRDESPAVIDRLHRMGYETSLLSGDREQVTREVAADVGIASVAAELSPQQKAEFFGHLGQAVIMVGDGVNDAPALAAADVGIAVGSASLISREVAAVTLLGVGLERLTDLFLVARRANRILRQNLLWVFGYNAVALALAAAGALHPIVAAAAMAASSITVLGNTLRV